MALAKYGIPSAALLSLGACVEYTPPAPTGYASLVPQPVSSAVALFDRYCVNAKPHFTAASKRDPQVAGPDGVTFNVSGEGKQKVCSMIAKSDKPKETFTLLGKHLGKATFASGSPLMVFEGKGRGPVFYSGQHECGTACGTFELAARATN